jgi:hypothetical protein
MGKMPGYNTEKPLSVFVKLCGLFFKLLGFILLTIPVGMLGNWLSAIIPIPFEDNIKNIIALALHHIIETELIIIVLTLLWAIMYIISQMKVPLLNSEISYYYLKQLIERTKTLAPEGFPTEMKGLSARLDDIFVSLKFHRDQSPTDYPLTKEDRDGVSVTNLWSEMTIDRPAAVIQGAPGMGKSTLITGLALYMARHCLY